MPVLPEDGMPPEHISPGSCAPLSPLAVPDVEDEDGNGVASASSHSHWRRASALLDDFLAVHLDANIPLGTLIDSFGTRAFGALLLVFAIPNIIPTPPGTSFVLGTPLVLLTGQMLLGWAHPWLPERLRVMTLKRETLERMAAASRAPIMRVERWLRPRWVHLANGSSERMLGGVMLILALILALPIPFGNIPPAIAISLTALGLMEKDGVCVALGLMVGVVAVGIVAVVLFGMLQAVWLIFAAFFP